MADLLDDNLVLNSRCDINEKLLLVLGVFGLTAPFFSFQYALPLDLLVQFTFCNIELEVRQVSIGTHATPNESWFLYG